MLWIFLTVRTILITINSSPIYIIRSVCVTSYHPRDFVFDLVARDLLSMGQLIPGPEKHISVKKPLIYFDGRKIRDIIYSHGYLKDDEAFSGPRMRSNFRADCVRCRQVYYEETVKISNSICTSTSTTVPALLVDVLF
jgi:hypothetical protein